MCEFHCPHKMVALFSTMTLAFGVLPFVDCHEENELTTVTDTETIHRWCGCNGGVFSMDVYPANEPQKKIKVDTDRGYVYLEFGEPAARLWLMCDSDDWDQEIDLPNGNWWVKVELQQKPFPCSNSSGRITFALMAPPPARAPQKSTSSTSSTSTTTTTTTNTVCGCNEENCTKWCNGGTCSCNKKCVGSDGKCMPSGLAGCSFNPRPAGQGAGGQGNMLLYRKLLWLSQLPWNALNVTPWDVYSQITPCNSATVERA